MLPGIAELSAALLNAPKRDAAHPAQTALPPLPGVRHPAVVGAPHRVLGLGALGDLRQDRGVEDLDVDAELVHVAQAAFDILQLPIFAGRRLADVSAAARPHLSVDHPVFALGLRPIDGSDNHRPVLAVGLLEEVPGAIALVDVGIRVDNGHGVYSLMSF